MKIKILGTAAAEGWPGIFCECPSCKRARKLGGKNLRSRSSLMLGEEYKVDLPPDTYLHLLKYNLHFSKLKHLFITHAHADHWAPTNLLMRRYPPFTKTPVPLLKIYGNKLVKKWMYEMMEKMEKGFEENRYSLQFRLVEPFRTFKAGELEVFPLLANHARNQTCYNYLFSTTSWSFLQAFDTGWYSEETWRELRKVASKKPLDLVIMDCTNGKINGGKQGGHLGIKMVVEMKEKLLAQGNLKSNCRFIATHFSHGGALLHQELRKILSPEGIEVAFDGMETFL